MPALRDGDLRSWVKHEEVQGKLYEIRYPVVGTSEFITVATTRPETMLGDTAIAVHPDDERYRALVGRQVRLPLADRLIPIVADEYADPATGSGAVKIQLSFTNEAGEEVAYEAAVIGLRGNSRLERLNLQLEIDVKGKA